MPPSWCSWSADSPQLEVPASAARLGCDTTASKKTKASLTTGKMAPWWFSCLQPRAESANVAPQVTKLTTWWQQRSLSSYFSNKATGIWGNHPSINHLITVTGLHCFSECVRLLFVGVCWASISLATSRANCPELRQSSQKSSVRKPEMVSP